MTDDAKAPQQGDDLDLTAEDEKILDEIWRELDRKWRDEEATEKRGDSAERP